VNRFSKEDWKQAGKLVLLHIFGSFLSFFVMVGAQNFLADVAMYQIYLVVILVGLHCFVMINNTVHYGGVRYYANLAVIRQARQEGKDPKAVAMPFRVWKGFALGAVSQLPGIVMTLIQLVMGEASPAALNVMLNMWFISFSKVRDIWPVSVSLLWLLCILFFTAVVGWAYTYGRTKRRRMLAKVYQSRKEVRQTADPRGGMHTEGEDTEA